MIRSLRLRLLLLFIAVLTLTAVAGWSLVRIQAQRLASNLQDENLAAMAFGFFSSVTASAGSWVTPEELETFFPSDLDQYYYRLLGPQGAYISGYNFVQIPVPADVESGVPYFGDFEDSSGNRYRGISLRLYLDQPDYPGWVTLEVAQSTRGQQRLIGEQMRAFGFAATSIALIALAAVIALLLLAFRPLQRLAISVERRGQHDLSPIRQPVPPEVQPLKDRLNRLFTNLEEAQAAKDRVIGNAAHQLRTPLTAIRLHANLAANSQLPEAHIKLIDQEAADAAKLTESLLKLEQTPHVKTDETFDLCEVCRAVFQDWEPSLTRANIQATFVHQGTRQVRGASALLAEVLSNLIDNVIQHSRAPNMRLVCAADRVEIIDTGVGVQDGEIDLIHERFFRGQGSTAPGHGLGLSIAAEFCARFGARLTTQNLGPDRADVAGGAGETGGPGETGETGGAGGFHVEIRFMDV